MPKIDASNRVGMFALKNAHTPIVARLRAEIQKTRVAADIRSLFAMGGADTVPMSIADFDARIKADTARFKDIVKETGIQADCGEPCVEVFEADPL